MERSVFKLSPIGVTFTTLSWSNLPSLIVKDSPIQGWSIGPIQGVY